MLPKHIKLVSNICVSQKIRFGGKNKSASSQIHNTSNLLRSFRLEKKSQGFRIWRFRYQWKGRGDFIVIGSTGIKRT